MQTALLQSAASICIAGAALGCIYVLVACVAVLRFTRRRRHASAPALPLSILLPVYGAEPRLFERAAAFCRQEYAAPVQLVFGTHDPADPAAEVVRNLQAAFPEQSIALKIEPREHGANRKVSNLINMLPLAQHDVIVIADSDIDVDAHYLSGVVGELHAPAVGAVTCVYHGMAAAGWWSRLSALGINTHFLPDAVTAVELHLAKPCFGATIAMRRETLNRTGGFVAFADCLADDYKLGQAVRSTGLRVAVPPFSVGHVCCEKDFNALLAGQLRTARAVRSINPLGHIGSILAHPFPLAIMGALLGSAGELSLAGLGVTAIALGCRATLTRCVERAFRLDRQHYWLIPLVELILFAAYLLSLVGRTVTWRGSRYRVASDGCLVKLENAGRERVR